MKRGRDAWLFALVIGVLIPALLLSGGGRGPNPENPLTTAPTESTQTEPETRKIVTIPVKMEDGSVVDMELETYILGVVLGEMPAFFESEALKAQAVVARTYALRKHLAGTKHAASAVCTESSCCQNYCSPEQYGGTEEDLEKIRQAVHDTAGMVLVYEGELIEATYFSCSGGKTEDAQAVWGTDVPYLQSTDSPGEEHAEYYLDTVSFSLEEFTALLGLDADGNGEGWVQDVSYTDGGGVAEMTICGTSYSGTELRSLLGLRSTNFLMTIVGQTVTITTKGFGHRVGMSQYGADAMAVEGQDFRQILSHYYQGTELISYDLTNGGN